MKTVLIGINARYIHVNSAIYSLKKSAEAYEQRIGASPGQILIREYTVNQGAEAVYYSILREQPDVAAFSVYIWNGPLVRDLCRDLRRALPECRIILGGPEVSYGVEHTGIDQYDYVIRGEGERAFYSLLAWMQDPAFRAPREWNFRREGKQVSAAPIEALEELPFIYEGMTEEFEHRILYYEASRGCPFRCAYCLSAAEKGVRVLSMERVLKDLTYLTEHNAALVKFVDRTFNCHPERSLRILEWIAGLPDHIRTCFHFEVEGDKLTPELIRAMGALPPGRIQAEIGIQSTCPEALAACGRTPSVERCFSHIRQLLAAGNMHIHVDLIAGLPGEGFKRFGQSLEEVYRLGAHQLQLGFLKRLEGTPLAAEAERYGYVFSPHPPYEILKNNVLTPRELWELKKIEDVLERYYNSGRFPQFLKELEQEYEGPFAMWQAIADFYESRGLIFASIGTAEVYSLAAEFVQGRSRREGLKEALLRDYYGFTPSDQLPEGLETVGRKPADHKRIAAGILKGLGDRNRRYMVRFINETPIIFDYTKKDPMTGRYAQQIV